VSSHLKFVILEQRGRRREYTQSFSEHAEILMLEVRDEWMNLQNLLKQLQFKVEATKEMANEKKELRYWNEHTELMTFNELLSKDKID